MDYVKRALRIVRLARSLGEYDCNIVGVAGEVIAARDLGMVKTPRQCKGIDGHAEIGGQLRTVQVKSLSTTRLRDHGGRTTFKVTKNPEPEHLFVVVVFEKRTHHEVIYSGPTNDVGGLARNTGSLRRPISVSDLFVERPTELAQLLERCKNDA